MISGKPKLVDTNKNRPLTDDALVRQLQEYHGVGAVVPNNRGGTTPIRFNLDTKKMEYLDSGSNTWKEVQ